MAERNSRNELAWGAENQEKLRKSKVLVAGTDILGQMVLGGLAGLGIGSIHLMDNRRVSRGDYDFLCSQTNTDIGQKKTSHIRSTLESINPSIDAVVAIHSRFSEALAYPLRPDIIVDATNDRLTKKKTSEYAAKYRIPVISASSGSSKAAVSVFSPARKIKPMHSSADLDSLLMDEFYKETQSPVAGGVIAGIACEEVRKQIFAYDKKDTPLQNRKKIMYNLNSESRTGVSEPQNIASYFRHRKMLVAGAGGIGTFVCLNLALLGVGSIDIVDFDSVEEHNLNRQLLFYGRQGELKAEVMAGRIALIDPHADASAFSARVGKIDMKKDRPWLEELYETDRKLWEQEDDNTREPDYPGFEDYVKKNFGYQKDRLLDEKIAEKGYDMIFGCLDNKYARIWLNNFSVNNKIPYIDGGTAARSGQVAVYVPGNTSCVDCQLDLKHLKRIPMHCHEADASVVMSNMVIGSAMVGEAVRIFSGAAPLNGILRYDPFSDSRLYIDNKRTRFAKKHGC